LRLRIKADGRKFSGEESEGGRKPRKSFMVAEKGQWLLGVMFSIIGI
jgi:hypothetical protein